MHQNFHKDRLALLAAVPDLMFRVDAEGTILDYHAPDPSILFVSPEQFMGRNMGAVLPPAVGARLAEAVRETLATRQQQRLEYHLEWEDERAHDFEARFVPSGEAAVVVVVRDVTEHRRAEVALRRSEERYRRLFESVPDAIIIFEPETLRVREVNDAALSLFGYTRNEFLELTLLDISAEPEVTNVAARRVSAGTTTFIPLRLHRRKDGTVFPVEICGNYFMIEGQRLGFGALRDITARREVEEQLRSLASQLVLAEEEERRRLAADLHDGLAQNLAMCLLRVGLLQDKEFEEFAEPLEQIHSLLEDSLKRAQSLTFELSPPALYDLGLAEAVRSMGERLFKGHNICLHFSSSPPCARLSDELRVVLFRAVRELFINVVKHAGAANVHAVIEHDPEWTRIEVQDDGTGYLEGETTGGGFGLFSIRQRLGHLGGRLDIEALQGGGTRVCLEAPLKAGLPPISSSR